MRGFFSGIVWGLVLAGIGVAVLSVLSPLAPVPEVAEIEPKLPVADAPKAEPITLETEKMEAEVVVAAPVVAENAAPEPDDLINLDISDTVAAAKPDVANMAQKLENPPDEPEKAELAQIQRDDSPRLLTDVGQSPKSPDAEVDPAAETGLPFRPDAPSVDIAAEGLAKLPASTGDAPTIVASLDTAPATGSVPIAVPAEPVVDTVPEASTTPAPAPVPDSKSEPASAATEPVSEATATTEDLPEPDASPLSEESSAPTVDQPVAQASDPEPQALPPRQIAVLPQTGSSDPQTGPRIGKRVVPLTERNGQAVREPLAKVAQENPDLPPLQRYATAFDNPENKPLMSIILIDDEAAIGAEALNEFPYPLAFAIDPIAPDAAEKMARHRDAGFEVLALIDLPTAATAQDAEVLLSASFDTLSEAVGVLEGTGTGVQGNRNLSGQVTSYIQSTGRGMVTQDSGLNTVHKLAVRDGVPAAVVFRDFDGEEQDPVIVRRFLDRAVFRASQDGSVIMMGRVRPATISALLLWGLQDRASRVVLAPVSAVLAGSVPAE